MLKELLRLTLAFKDTNAQGTKKLTGFVNNLEVTRFRRDSWQRFDMIANNPTIHTLRHHLHHQQLRSVYHNGTMYILQVEETACEGFREAQLSLSD